MWCNTGSKLELLSRVGGYTILPVTSSFGRKRICWALKVFCWGSCRHDYERLGSNKSRRLLDENLLHTENVFRDSEWVSDRYDGNDIWGGKLQFSVTGDFCSQTFVERLVTVTLTGGRGAVFFFFYCDFFPYMYSSPAHSSLFSIPSFFRLMHG